LRILTFASSPNASCSFFIMALSIGPAARVMLELKGRARREEVARG
jgi:hypothetical protein